MKIKKYWKSAVAIILLFAISACGNPNLGISPGDAPGTAATAGDASNSVASTASNGYSIRMVLVNATDDQATTSISSSNPGKLIATVTNDAGTPQNNVLISFSSDFASFSPISATALTDTNGQANILLIPGELSGAGAVIASFTLDNEEIKTQLNFNVANAGDTSSNVLSTSLTDANNALITAIRADLPGTLTATLQDENGNGIGGVVIKVEGKLATFSPENGTVVTDNNGIANITLLAGEKTGADTLTITATTTSEILTSLLVYQVNPPALQIGNSSGGSFVSELLGISTTSLAASATTSITVDIVDADGNPFSTPIEVEFTSNCVAAGTSLIDNKVTTINGQAVATYEAKGCQGDDLVTATARYSGTVFTATGTITVAPDTAGYIEFLSASPDFIAINGTGGAGLSEVSTVTFRVRSKLGAPLPNQLVNFSLNTNVGNMSITPSSKTTNAAGEVTTTVKSGNVSSTVRVTATVDSTNISAQSDQLIVSTGVPDQNSMSLALSSLNPEAFSYDNETVTVTARLADRYNNPVPDGTAIYFTTEGGAIEPGCNTVKGACSVTWTSQDPRPVDHRATILAVAVGDESFFDEDGNGSFNDSDGEPFSDAGNGFYDEPFTDSNGNGIFDEPFVDTNTNNTYNFGENFVDYNKNGRYDGAGNNPAGELTYIDANGNGIYDGSGTIVSGDDYTEVTANGIFDAPGFSDLPEAYLDSNENTKRDSGEPYLDFNNNGQYDTRDGEYNGILCTHTSICSPNRSIHVRQSKVLTMSGSSAYIIVQDTASGDIYASNHPSVATTATLDVSGGGSKQLNIFVMDSAGQVMPKGTTINISADVGTLVGELDFSVGSTTNQGGHTLEATISDDDAANSASGFILIEVTTLKQHTSMLSIALTI